MPAFRSHPLVPLHRLHAGPSLYPVQLRVEHDRTHSSERDSQRVSHGCRQCENGEDAVSEDQVEVQKLVVSEKTEEGGEILHGGGVQRRTQIG